MSDAPAPPGPEAPPSGDCPLCAMPDGARWRPSPWPAMDGDRCEVSAYSPDHHTSLAALGPGGVRGVVDLWAERTDALGSRPDIGYVLIFENRGAEAGADTDHPHSQIYGFAAVPPTPAAELNAIPCRVCLEDPGDRLVAESMGWRAWVPAAAAWPYSIVLAPVSHRPDLPALGGWERDALAQLLADVLGRLDALFDAPMPYYLWIHQRPTDDGAWPNSHLHVEVTGLYQAAGTLRCVAAGELGSGIAFNPVPAPEAAARLRAARPLA